MNPDIPREHREEERAEQEGRLELGEESLPSELHPERNEDAVLVDSHRRLFGVFDGLGGEAGGLLAARIASEQVGEHLRDLPDNVSVEETRTAMVRALKRASRKILEASSANPEFSGMATTATVAKLVKSEGERYTAVIGQVGDSRAYVWDETGLAQITLDDHSFFNFGDEAQARYLQGKLSNAQRANDLTGEELAFFQRRNILSQVLGSKDVDPHIYDLEFHPGDRLVLVTDGINNLTDREIDALLVQETILSAQKKAEALVASARVRSREAHMRAQPDDMSAIVVELKKQP